MGLEGNLERDLGRLEGKMDAVKSSVDKVETALKDIETKVDLISTSHNTLKTVFDEQTKVKSRWRDPAVAAISGGVSAGMLNWVFGLFRH